jgi:tRNA(fMet)-specific endonuclease VapC
VTYLLDTNVLSEPLVARPDPGVVAGLREHADASALAALTWHEMYYGMERLEPGRRKAQIQE